MKTAKPVKSAGRPKKAATAAKTVKTAKSVPAKGVRSVKVAAVKPGPTEEEIRARAKEIYNERVSRGEFGSPEDDWFKAVESLKKK